MILSTAGLLKRRFASGTRTTGNLVVSAKVIEGASVKLEAASVVLRMNSLLFMVLVGITVIWETAPRSVPDWF